MSGAIFEPPPTYAPFELRDSQGSPYLNPIWVKWLLDIAQEINAFNSGFGVLTAGPTSDASALHGHRHLVTPVDDTPAVSPATYTNNSGEWDMDYLVLGGTGVNLEFQRGSGTVYNLGVGSGFVHLSPGDSLIVSFSTAPTVTQIYR